MKKEMLVFSISLMLLIIAFTGCIEETPPFGSYDSYVDDDGGKDFTNIQDAIDAATNGDTVFVYSGIYNENLVINKSISLIGENKDSTIITGDGDNEGIYIVKDQINVSGFTINNELGTGSIRIVSSFNTISDNNLSDNGWGVTLKEAPNNIISGNIIGNNVDGIQMWDSDYCSILDNIIFSNNSRSNFGLYADSCNETIFSDNTVFTSKRGIQFISSKNLTISGNTIYSNSNTGLHLSDSSHYCIVTNNNISLNGHGIFLISSNNSKIYRNNFINNSESNAFELSYQPNGLDNSWDFGSIGNYWSDYNGTDGNIDGIGDTPYVIPVSDHIETAQNQDNYPLMNPVDI